MTTPTDKERLDYLEKMFDGADGQYQDKQSVTGWLTRYIYWGKRTGASGSIRKAIDENMRERKAL
jgi:hypothetical protein